MCCRNRCRHLVEVSDAALNWPAFCFPKPPHCCSMNQPTTLTLIPLCGSVSFCGPIRVEFWLSVTMFPCWKTPSIAYSTSTPTEPSLMCTTQAGGRTNSNEKPMSAVESASGLMRSSRRINSRIRLTACGPRRLKPKLPSPWLSEPSVCWQVWKTSVKATRWPNCGSPSLRPVARLH